PTCATMRATSIPAGRRRKIVKKTGRPTRASRKRSAPARRSAVAEVLAAFARAAGRRRWYLFGAQAVSLYGVPRTTAAIDVTAALPEREAAGFVKSLAAAGLALRVSDPDFVARTRVLPLEHAPTGFPVDVVLAGPGLEERFLDGARQVRLGTTRVWVI